ncbi:cobalt ECF transporter T component CbiQ [Rhodococcus qingshengii]|uniref:cobalt ECF transporter T component CbiQ n=1 Tax=Rhodococcus qingshengii TaxID=334542 RepID=UPI001C5D2FCB|nr:cobalt ECF transporter T component CbiQ [Rhodococcus qingshengii]MBW4818790.1 cobalt ECF transporter T component CbiQ [Rhodococcus qingshengii]
MGLSVTAIDSVAWRSTWKQRSVAEKTVLYGGIVGLVLVLPVWPAVPILLAICAASAVMAHVPIPHLLRCLRAPAVFIAVAAASTVISLDVTIWRLSITPGAAAQAAELAARALTASTATLLFASTSPMTSVMAALRRAGVPAACVDVVTVMYRLVFVLVESVRVIRQAQAARLGYTSVRRSLESAGMLIAAALTRSWSQARRLEIGLEGRDFGVSMPDLSESGVHWRFLAVSGGVLAAVALLSIEVGVMS